MLRQLLLCGLVMGAFSAPQHTVVKKSGNIPAKQGAAGGAGPPYPMWHLEPLYVRKVTPGPSKRSVAKVQEQRSVFSSLDGEQHSLQQQMEQVSKNGELVGSVFQQQRGDGTHPLEKLTKVDIPRLGVHQQLVDTGDQEAARTNVVKRNAPAVSGLEMPSAEELARYILTTGDQQTVVTLIEAMVEGGEMSEEQALVTVETVKALLDGAERELEEEAVREVLLERRLQEEAEREAAVRNMIHNSGPKAPRRKSDEDLYRQLKGALY